MCSMSRAVQSQYKSTVSVELSHRSGEALLGPSIHILAISQSSFRRSSLGMVNASDRRCNSSRLQHFASSDEVLYAFNS